MSTEKPKDQLKPAFDHSLSQSEIRQEIEDRAEREELPFMSRKQEPQGPNKG